MTACGDVAIVEIEFGIFAVGTVVSRIRQGRPLVGGALEEETSQARADGGPDQRRWVLSVFITLTAQADPAKVEQVLQANADRVQRINEQAQSLGAIHHRFVGGDGVVMVLDEWDSPESFHKFFENNTDIPVIMQEIGVTSAPDIKVWNTLDTRDEF
jgi:quinol monooxygenase YgiN